MKRYSYISQFTACGNLKEKKIALNVKGIFDWIPVLVLSHTRNTREAFQIWTLEKTSLFPYNIFKSAAVTREPSMALNSVLPCNRWAMSVSSKQWTLPRYAISSAYRDWKLMFSNVFIDLDYLKSMTENYYFICDVKMWFRPLSQMYLVSF